MSSVCVSACGGPYVRCAWAGGALRGNAWMCAWCGCGMWPRRVCGAYERVCVTHVQALRASTCADTPALNALMAAPRRPVQPGPVPPRWLGERTPGRGEQSRLECTPWSPDVQRATTKLLPAPRAARRNAGLVCGSSERRDWDITLPSAEDFCVTWDPGSSPHPDASQA